MGLDIANFLPIVSIFEDGCGFDELNIQGVYNSYPRSYPSVKFGVLGPQLVGWRETEAYSLSWVGEVARTYGKEKYTNYSLRYLLK